MISTDAIQVDFLSSLTIINEESSLKIINKGSLLMIVSETTIFIKTTILKNDCFSKKKKTFTSLVSPNKICAHGLKQKYE